MFDWFLTLPGILVICGVVLLLIAVVLFIKGNKNGNKEVVEEKVEEPKEEVKLTAEEEIKNMYTFDNTIENSEKVEENVPAEEVKIEEPVVDTPVVETNDSYNFNESGVVTQEVQIEEPVVATEESVSAPAEEIVIEEPAPVETSNTYNFNETSSITTDTVEPTVEQPVIDIPIVAPMDDVQPKIYGGNDPLENTQVLPEVEKAPYGIETPVEEPVVAAPVEEANNAALDDFDLTPTKDEETIEEL